MSQDRSFSFAANSSQHDHQSRLPEDTTFSLAGNTQHEQPGSLRRLDSYVTPEYQAYHAGYDEAEQPVWGLAKPLPRLVRPGMRPHLRRATQNSKDSTVRLTNIPSNQPIHPHDGNGAALTEIPSRSNISHPQRLPSGISQPQHSLDRIRSSSLRSHGQKPDLQRLATSNALHQRGRPISTSDHTRPEIPKHSSHDFGTDLIPEDSQLQPSRSEEDDINAGRQRLQDLADSASHNTNALYNQPTANIDWEEFQAEQTASLKPRPSAQPTQPDFFNTWAKYRHKLRKPLAEFLGTIIFMIIGLSAALVPRLSLDKSGDYGNFLTTNLAWGFGSMTGIYVAGGVSGAHLNPAISMTLAIYRGFPWRSCWKYIIAQMLAAFIAAWIVYGVYRDAINALENQAYAAGNATGVNNATAVTNMTTSNIFYTTPNPSISAPTAFFSQFLAIALFTCCVLAMGDDLNAPPGAGMQAFIVGLLVFSLSTAFPYNTGMCLSPARDFGPRLVVALVFNKWEVFTERAWYWLWGVWIAVISGSLVGALVYDLLIFTGGESPVNYPAPGTRVLERIQDLKGAVRVGHSPKDENLKERGLV